MYKTMKIYFDKTSGEVLYSSSYNYEVTPNFDNDYKVIKSLNSRDKETIGMLVLSNGQYAQDFAESNGYRVNPVNKTLEFSYPDPNEPEIEQPYQVPLSEEVEQLKHENELLKAQNKAMSERADFVEDVVAELAIQVYQ